eukprot:6950074-Lingulodinium_polyedra.AAC.1
MAGRFSQAAELGQPRPKKPAAMASPGGPMLLEPVARAPDGPAARTPAHGCTTLGATAATGAA